MNQRARRWLVLPFGVGDGALGTSLQAQGLPVGRASDAWNLEHPERVRVVHQSFRDTGAAWLQTNTFGATSLRLGADGLAGRVREINHAGVALAREAAGLDCAVFGTIGPVATPDATAADIEAAYAEQVTALAEAGVDGFLIETVLSQAEGVAAVRTAATAQAGPVVACYTPGADGALLDGTPAERAAEAFVRAGAAVVGVNCGSGPASLLEPARRLVRADLAPVYAAPSAGLPVRDGATLTYDLTPDAFAAFAAAFQAAGVRYFAGCCGIAPAHIAAAVHRTVTDARGEKNP